MDYQRTCRVEIGHVNVCRSISVDGLDKWDESWKKAIVTDNPWIINFILCGRMVVNKNFVVLQCSEKEVFTHINFPKMQKSLFFLHIQTHLLLFYLLLNSDYFLTTSKKTTDNLSQLC